MTESLPQWWHQWRGELPIEPDGTSGGGLTITLGPTMMGPDDPGQDGLGIPIRLRTLPLQLITDQEGPRCVYVGSFNSDPAPED